jgi:hypothetical protein
VAQKNHSGPGAGDSGATHLSPKSGACCKMQVHDSPWEVVGKGVLRRHGDCQGVTAACSLHLKVSHT